MKNNLNQYLKCPQGRTSLPEIKTIRVTVIWRRCRKDVNFLLLSQQQEDEKGGQVAFLWLWPPGRAGPSFCYSNYCRTLGTMTPSSYPFLEKGWQLNVLPAVLCPSSLMQTTLSFASIFALPYISLPTKTPRCCVHFFFQIRIATFIADKALLSWTTEQQTEIQHADISQHLFISNWSLPLAHLLVGTGENGSISVGI